MIQRFEQWLLLPERIALHEASATAVIADVHLGYSAARRRLGDAIPERSVSDDLQPLALAAKQHDIRRLVVAGDLFEHGFDMDLGGEFLKELARLRINLLAVTPGNHDRGIDQATGWPLFPAGFDLDGWHICHGDEPSESSRAIMGHWHPATRMGHRKVPAFLVRDQQLILPAFSRDAAGVELQKDDRWRDWRCYAIPALAVSRFPCSRNAKPQAEDSNVLNDSECATSHAPSGCDGSTSNRPPTSTTPNASRAAPAGTDTSGR